MVLLFVIYLADNRALFLLEMLVPIAIVRYNKNVYSVFIGGESHERNPIFTYG
ncbi:predicted protein [Listeria monocytogenes FSL J2-071]|nr:predicted protein [Listeria monocytogenes FSL J2-071]